MSEPELTPIVDKNGVFTHRYKRPQSPSAAQQQALAAVPVPSASAEDAFADVTVKVVDGSSLGPVSVDPAYRKTFVELTHPSGRQIQVSYTHLSDHTPHSQEVLAYLSLRSRLLKLYSAQDLSSYLGFTEKEADSYLQENQHIDQQLHYLLDEEYEEITEAALETQPGTEPSVRAVAAPLREVTSWMHRSGVAAREEGDLDAYVSLRVLSRDVAASIERNDSAEEVRAWIGDIEHQARLLEREDSYYGWVLDVHAQQLRSILALLRNERSVSVRGRHAAQIPELPALVNQMRAESSSIGDLRLRESLQQWAQRVQQLIDDDASPALVLREAADVVGAARRVAGDSGAAVLHGYARKVRRLVRSE